jgi:hydroxymethylbilane synthase
VPIAGFATLDGSRLHLDGLVGDPDAGTLIRASAAGEAGNAMALGERVAAELLAQGAERVLRARRGA